MTHENLRLGPQPDALPSERSVTGLGQQTHRSKDAPNIPTPSQVGTGADVSRRPFGRGPRRGRRGQRGAMLNELARPVPCPRGARIQRARTSRRAPLSGTAPAAGSAEVFPRRAQRALERGGSVVCKDAARAREQDWMRRRSSLTASCLPERRRCVVLEHNRKSRRKGLRRRKAEGPARGAPGRAGLLGVPLSPPLRLGRRRRHLLHGESGRMPKS